MKIHIYFDLKILFIFYKSLHLIMDYSLQNYDKPFLKQVNEKVSQFYIVLYHLWKVMKIKRSPNWLKKWQILYPSTKRGEKEDSETIVQIVSL